MRTTILLGLLLAAVAGQGAAQQPAAAAVPLYTDLGAMTVPITTRIPEAQRYFDQGMRLTYGFNHAEAVRSFEEAERVDPGCAMCAWGAALARGPNINAPVVDSLSLVEARAASSRAMARRGGLSPRERALIEAVDQRYGDPRTPRARLDSAWADAMALVADRFPDDPDAQVLHADALMTLSPWNYWTSDLAPRPATPTILRRLETTLARTPDHPGACHYFIHAVEAAEPARALPCAERLAALMPGAGHIVHMPGHIYIRLGRYDDAIAANEHATHTDEAFLEGNASARSTMYGLGYYPHNYHFLSYVAFLTGRSTLAIGAARATADRLHPEISAADPTLAAITPVHLVMLASFGKWDEVLAAPLLPESNVSGHGIAHFARGLALAARGDRAGAMRALAVVTAAVPRAADGDARTVLRIAEHALQGEIAYRTGEFGAAEKELRAALAIEDAMPYIEPPVWFYPVRHQLGRVLLDAGRFAEAERAYREDLARFPGNVWSLTGLNAALVGQGKAADAARLAEALTKARTVADLPIDRSRF